MLFRRFKLKYFGRSKISGSRIESSPEHTAEPKKFSINSYYTEEIICRDCGNLFVHTAEEKRKYFEELKGNIYSRFIYCKDCYAERKNKS